MEEMQQITLDQWLSWKEEIREKLRETSENFVHIGYRLKQIRDSGMFNGEADIFGFALKEYGLSKSTTSRFIAINERFSEGGNSIFLRQEYKELGSSKLAEMLALSDSECQMITERTTVKEIRELKEFSRQQASEPEGEEGSQDGEEKKLTPLQKCLVDYFRNKKEMLNAVMRAYREDALKMAAELMNPSGYATHKKGLCFLFMYEYEKGVTAKIMTEPEPRKMSWEELLNQVSLIFGDSYEKSGWEDVHGAYYEAPEEPETAESQDTEDFVATSQREEPEEDEADENLGAIWCQIEDLDEDIALFIGYYNADDAANGDIPLDALKTAYKNTIDMAAGLEQLLMNAGKEGTADE